MKNPANCRVFVIYFVKQEKEKNKLMKYRDLALYIFVT